MGAKGLKNRYKLILLALILTIFGIIIAFFIGYRSDSTNNDPQTLDSGNEEVGVAIGRVHQTATRNGKTEWKLDAESVRYVEDEKKAVFTDVFMTFFLDNGEKVFLSANEGIFQTETNDIEANGNVVVKTADYRLTTETIFYRHADRMIHTKAPVKITGNIFSLMADTMQVDLNQKNAMFIGHIKGNIDENARF